MNSDEARYSLVEAGRSLHRRGLTHGATGNMSVRFDDGWLVTPTGSTLGTLDAGTISELDHNWRHLRGATPTKEIALHIAFATHLGDVGAIVHLHSPYAVAVSCLRHTEESPPIPVLTPYFAMKVGDVGWLPYLPPGDPGLATEMALVAPGRRAVLLANHGPIVAHASLSGAIDVAEELEAAARLAMILHGRDTVPLDSSAIAELRRRFE